MVRLIKICFVTTLFFVLIATPITSLVQWWRWRVPPLASPAAATQMIPSSVDFDLKHIPIGDGRISSQPEVGSIWSCRTRFRSRIGAHATGDWIQADGTYDLTAKPTVNGKVYWSSEFKIVRRGDIRAIVGNRLPQAPTGKFPISPHDDAYAYDRNPNSIKALAYRIELPAMPQVTSPSCVPMGAIGVLLNGGYFFNALDARGKDAVAHEIQDGCQGHPEIHGAYHYHSVTTCIEEKSGSRLALVGYAFDGFGIYGHYGENGKELTNADLDECHGHIAKIKWNGKKKKLYHYHATWEYPYTIGCYRGTPGVVTIQQ